MRLTKRDLLRAKNGAILQFSGEDNSTGGVVFNNNLALSSSSPVTMSMQETFSISGADAYFSNNINTSGSLSVDGATALANTLTVTSGSELQGTLNVTGESIFATNTTVSGTLKAESDLDFSTSGGNIKAGSIDALTVNSAGEVTKIGQDTPGGGQFLKWDGSKVVWDDASVTALSLDAITAATGSETRVQTSGDLHLDSTGGEIFLSSSDDFNFLSNDSASAINFKNTGVTTVSAGQISLSIIDRGGNKNFSSLTFNGLNIRDKNNDASNQNIGGLGTNGAEILNNNVHGNQYSPMVIGTKNMNNADSYGQNVTGSLVFAANDRRFIFCDTGRIQTSGGHPYPFFHIKKQRASLTNLNNNFEVEFNATKGTGGSWLQHFYNTNFLIHSTFLKFNQDGQITKLGHDTPAAGDVLSWDNNGYVVWSPQTVNSLSINNLTAGTTDNRIQTSGDLHLDSTGGELFLSSSVDFNFLSDNSAASINFKNTGIATANRGEIKLHVTDRGSNKNLSSIEFNGLSIIDSNNDDGQDANLMIGIGTHGAEITNSNDIDTQYSPMFIGTKNVNAVDGAGQYVSGSLIFGASDRRFMFCDTGRATTGGLGYPYPFFHIKKIRDTLTNYSNAFEVEFNATKGTTSKWLPNFYNGVMTHSTFLKFNQDGQITKLGQGTPTDGQVLSWDNTNGYVVWSDAASGGSQTLSGLTDTNIPSTPNDGDYLKYDASSSKWVPASGPVGETYESKSSSFTAAVNYHYSISTTNNPVIVTLPNITNANKGNKIIIKFKTGTNLLQVNADTGSPGDTIEGAVSQTLSDSQDPGVSMILVSDGVSNWEII